MSDPEPRDPYAPPDPDAPPNPPDRPWPDRPAPPPPPVRRGRARRPDGPAEPGGRLALLLAVAGSAVTLLLFPSPVAVPLGLALALGGVVTGWRARRRARRAGRTAPGAVAAMTAGTLGTLVAGFLGTALLLFHSEITDYQECLRGANTRVATAVCREELGDRIEERTGVRP